MDASQIPNAGDSTFEKEARLAELATRQHGVVARRQLNDIGFSDTAIKRRVDAKYLHRLYPGVYAVGHTDMSRLGWRMAACLVCGKTACLSHRTAGHAWAVVDTAPSKIHVTLAARSKPKHDGIEPHLSKLPDDETTELDHIPTTTLARTVVDLSSTNISDFGLRVVLAKAERAALDWRDLEALVDRYPRRHGVPRLRRVMEADELIGIPNGPAEIEVGEWLIARDLPLPEFNQPVAVDGVWIRPDAIWRRQRVAAEFQSRRHHDGWLGRVQDAERLDALRDAEWEVVEITAHGLAENARLERRLRKLLL